jgi:hypothetical protein
MADGPDHHAMSALMQNASGSGDQDGGGGSGGDNGNEDGDPYTLEGVNATIGSEALNAPIVSGPAGKKMFKSSLNGNLMASLKGRNGDKGNPFKGMQSVQVNAAAGKSIGGPGAGATFGPPTHNVLGGGGQSR